MPKPVRQFTMSAATRRWRCLLYYCRRSYSTEAEARECEVKHWQDDLITAVAERDAEFALNCDEHLRELEIV